LEADFYCIPVGGFSTHLKNISQLGSFLQAGMNIQKYLKPPPGIGFSFEKHVKDLFIVTFNWMKTFIIGLAYSK